MLLDSSKMAESDQDRSETRQKLIAEVIRLVEDCFPSVSIRLLGNVAAINAQASQLREELLVDLFGGLAFHPDVESDALAFALLHELGHQFGTGPRISPNSEMACDCAADRWAVVEGVPALARRNCPISILAALTQLRKATAHLRNEGNKLPPNCWCFDWNKRKDALLSETIPSLDSRCAVTNQFLKG